MADVILDNSTKTKTDDSGAFIFEKVATNRRHDLTVYESNSIIYWKQFFIPNNKNTFTLSVLQIGAVASQTSRPIIAPNTTTVVPVAPINSSAPDVPFVKSSTQASYEVSLVQKGQELPKHTQKPGANPFNFTFWISTSPQTLSQIDTVSYYLHPTFNPQVVTKVSLRIILLYHLPGGENST
jgi:hypothetical protein